MPEAPSAVRICEPNGRRHDEVPWLTRRITEYLGHLDVNAGHCWSLFADGQIFLGFFPPRASHIELIIHT
jgi:hypothetical protein